MSKKNYFKERIMLLILLFAFMTSMEHMHCQFLYVSL